MLIKLLAFIVLIASALAPAAIADPTQEIDTDLAIVFAVDASSSVDDFEFAVQLRGIAHALRQADVIDAIKSGPTGRIDVALLLWSDAIEQTDRYGWVRISGEKDALNFAELIESFPRRVRGSTSIGSAIMASLELFGQRVDRAGRYSIDISGDGMDNVGRDLEPTNRSTTAKRQTPASVARSVAEKLDITINALALPTEERDLVNWYHLNVVTEDGFVMTAESLSVFAHAFHRKLLREIRQPVLSFPLQRIRQHHTFASRSNNRQCRGTRPVWPLLSEEGLVLPDPPKT